MVWERPIESKRDWVLVAVEIVKALWPLQLLVAVIIAKHLGVL